MPAPVGGIGGAIGPAASRSMLDRLQQIRDQAGIQVPVLRPGAAARAASEATGTAHAPTFGETLRGFVNDVSAQQDAASDLRDRFLRGEPVELHQVMAAGEEAGLSLELMISLRDKVLDAYRQLTTMQ